MFKTLIQAVVLMVVSTTVWANDTRVLTDISGSVYINCAACKWTDKTIQEAFEPGVVVHESDNWVYVLGTIQNDADPAMYYVHKSGSGEVGFFGKRALEAKHWAIREVPEGLRIRYVDEYEFGEELIRPSGAHVYVWVGNPDHTQYTDVQFNAWVEDILPGDALKGGMTLVTRKDGSVYNPNTDSIVE